MLLLFTFHVQRVPNYKAFLLFALLFSSEQCLTSQWTDLFYFDLSIIPLSDFFFLPHPSRLSLFPGKFSPYNYSNALAYFFLLASQPCLFSTCADVTVCFSDGLIHVSFQGLTSPTMIAAGTLIHRCLPKLFISNRNEMV